MLVPSDRHRPEDLSLWEELEAGDRLHARRLLRSGRIERSLAAIRSFVADGPCYAGTSWGKDSVVLCHLLRRATPSVPLVHLRPSNRGPGLDAVRDTYFVGWPGQSYEEEPVDYGRLHAAGLPDHELDRETDQRWYGAIARVSQRYGPRHVLGLRAGESFGRLMRCRRHGESSPNGCAPLAWWTTADIFAYLAHYDLPVHPSYAMLGGGRWPRERIRVAEIGDTHGKGGGRAEWEAEYYGDVLRRLAARQSSSTVANSGSMS